MIFHVLVLVSQCAEVELLLNSDQNWTLLKVCFEGDHCSTDGVEPVGEFHMGVLI